ncbi:MAG: signal peptide peptidase SppA [Bdellovibrionales bacterium]
MKKVIVRVLAVIGFLTVMSVSSLVALGLFAVAEKRKEPESIVLTIDFNKSVVESDEPSPVDFAINEESIALTDVLRAIDRAKTDPRVKAVVGKFGPTQLSLAHAQEIRAAIAAFRAAKKPSYAYATSYGQLGGSGKIYFLASAFETLWLQPIGAVSISGPAIQSPFFRETLDKLGAKADFLQREEYKSFMDMATRNDFAAPVRENLESLLSDLADQMATGVSESRSWDAARVRQIMAHGPYTDQEALKAGLVSRLGYEDELEKSLKESISKDVKFVGPQTYLSYAKRPAKEDSQKPTHIALIHGVGTIIERASDGGSLTGGKILGADVIVDAFNQAIEEKDIKAILFRIDSPGGSPEASESIRRVVVRAKQAGKPVVVSMGNVAASGGYWSTMNADRIIANPGTLTGSIGVISGKFVVGPALEKLGIRLGTLVARNAASGIGTESFETMWSTEKEFTPAQRERLAAMIDRTYQAFIENVAEARKIPLDKMRDFAKGRVYTGAQAQKIGLVDTLGGFKTAIATVREQLKLEPDAPINYVVLPEPQNTVEKLMKFVLSLGGVETRISPAIAALGLERGNPLLTVWQESIHALRPASAAEARLPFAESLTP